MFSINDGHSNALSAGIQTETEARNIAARTADERGESVWLSGPGIEGEEEIAPDGQGAEAAARDEQHRAARAQGMADGTW